jgi:hypothetical protein
VPPVQQAPPTAPQFMHTLNPGETPLRSAQPSPVLHVFPTQQTSLSPPHVTQVPAPPSLN